MGESETTAAATLLSLRAAGVATPNQIKVHFTHNFYPDLTATLEWLERDGLVEQVDVVENSEAVIRAIESLAGFIGADAIDYGDLPANWVQ